MTITKLTIPLNEVNLLQLRLSNSMKLLNVSREDVERTRY